MAENSNKNADIDSSFTSVPATQELFSRPEPDDTFLTVQRSTFAVGKIYNDLFANSRSDFISELSELCCVAELRYVRDMVFCIAKRKLGQSNLGNLTERRSGANVKDNLLEDIYNLYSLGEKSIDALPKNMIRSDTRFCSQEVQTDTCLSNTLFATKSDVEELKNDLLSKLSDLREEFTSVKCPPAPVVSSPSESDDDSTQFPSSQVSPSSTLTQTPASSQNKNVSASGQVHKAVDKPNPGKASRKVLIAGDSLLNRMYISKMKVSDIPSVKLTNRGDNLSGTISRCINYASKHSSETLDVVLLAGTNDLSNRSVSPEKLIHTLDSSLKELKQFNNVHHVFLCKIPPRFDFHNVNIKVNQYNNILSERFSDSEHISVIDTIPPEFRFYYVDGLHLAILVLIKFVELSCPICTKFLLLLTTRNVRVQVKIAANATLSVAPHSTWAVGMCSILELHNYILMNWLIPLIFLQFLSIVFLKSSLKYLRPALIILTKAPQ